MTTNLNLPEMASTGQKEVVFNDAMSQLDSALTSKITLPVDDSNELTLTSAQFRENVFFDLTAGSPVPDAASSLFVPAISRGQFVVRNNTGQDVTVEISGQSHTAGVLADGEIGKFLCDGSDVYLIAQGSGS